MRLGAELLVEQAVHELFDRRDVTAVGRYWSPGYVEHSILGTDGLRGLRDLAGSLPAGFRHARTRVLGENDLVVAHGRYEGLGAASVVAFDMGQFVFTQGEGMLRGKPTAFYDLFRVEGDKLAEHWDVVFAKPTELGHDNGLF